MSMRDYRRAVGSTYYSGFGHAAGAGLVGGAVRGAYAGYQQGSVIHPAVGLALAGLRAPVQSVAQAFGNVASHAVDRVRARADVGVTDAMTSALSRARRKKKTMGGALRNAQFEAKHRRVHGKFA